MELHIAEITACTRNLPSNNSSSTICRDREREKGGFMTKGIVTIGGMIASRGVEINYLAPCN
jgi:hypothetical protein